MKKWLWAIILLSFSLFLCLLGAAGTFILSPPGCAAETNLIWMHRSKIGLTFQIQNVIISIIISIRQSRCSLFVGSFVWNLNVFFVFAHCIDA